MDEDRLIIGYVNEHKVVSIVADEVETLTIKGRRFIATDVDEALHYDFYADGEIAGIELHTFEQDSDLIYQHAEQRGLIHRAISPFPRWPLGDSFEGEGMGVMGFGDLVIYASDAGDYLVSVPLDGWLTTEQAESVRRAIEEGS